ncbi:MAG: hypothetical protein AAF418_00375 [Pseudomonadota bacterium]
MKQFLEPRSDEAFPTEAATTDSRSCAMNVAIIWPDRTRLISVRL